jgi:hypothetical protein
MCGGAEAEWVNVVCLLALDDRGAPAYDHEHARALANLSSPALACTPDPSPERMAAAIMKQDIATWAARHEIVAAR